MRPLRLCLECGAPYRHVGSRCRGCELMRHRRRNAARAELYGGTWPATSRAARKAQPWCSLCGATTDLTLDHEHRQVECRSCNSSHHRKGA